jgi:flagellar basal body-associated protein FliL
MEEKNYPLKLTFPQIWIALTVAAGLFGTVYMAGVKTEAEVKKVELLKQEQNYLNQISVINVNLRKEQDDAIYYKDRYSVTRERLTNCLRDKENLIQSGEADDREEKN